jgi:hypothetical protein
MFCSTADISDDFVLLALVGSAINLASALRDLIAGVETKFNSSLDIN